MNCDHFGEQPVDEKPADTPGVSLADAVAVLRAPGAFDSLRDQVADAVANGNVATAPSEVRW